MRHKTAQRGAQAVCRKAESPTEAKKQVHQRVLFFIGPYHWSGLEGRSRAPTVWEKERRKPSEQRAMQTVVQQRDDCELWFLSTEGEQCRSAADKTNIKNTL